MRKRAYRATILAHIALVLSSIASADWVWTPQTGRLVNLKRLPKETPELQVEYARSLMIAGNYKEALRETNKFGDFFDGTDFDDDNQFVRGEIRMAQGKYPEAAKDFQQVIANYPDTDLYDQVIAKQYEIGDAMYEKGLAKLEKRWRLFRKKPLKSAIEVYSMVIDNQPFTDAAAQGQYKVGLCHFTLDEYTAAAYEYRRVIEDYMQSEWVDEASHGLAMCYYEASLPPEYDQGVSKLGVGAIDSFKARYPADERVADLDAMRVQMRERIATQRLQTAEFYERRRLFDAARIYYNVVVEQFPETAVAQTARDWLAKNPAPVKQT